MTARSLLALLVTAALAGCGGGDSGSASDARDSGGSGASYDFKPPPVNTTLTYQQTEVDNAQNNIVQAFTDVIQAVNADGSYTVVQEGSTAHQQSLTSTLGAIAADTAAAGIRPPAVVVIGDVVAVAEEFTPSAG